ncbi:MAG: glycosyltransferase family 4 protein [Planctomycetes bacterium]|nr:glycosyltransferase family 4 protein [Planctomycetota bacterium]
MLDEDGNPIRTAFVVYESRFRLLRATLREFVFRPARSTCTFWRAFCDTVMPGEPTPFVQRLKVPLQAAAGIGLASWLRRCHVGHIHCHFAHAPTTVGMYAALQLGIPFSFTGHANDLFQRRALLRRKLERARFVACISEWHREYYRAIVPRDPECYPIIRCGVETTAWKPPDRAEEHAGPFTLLTVGRLIPKKGIDLLIRAVGSHSPGHGKPWHVVVAGDGPERSRLTNLARQCGCDDRFRWLGAVPNSQVHELMSQADLFVLPCRTDENGDRDGIPVVLMEAMACGLPVVAGDLPSLRELVEDGITGRLVPPDRPDLLEAVIEDLQRKPALRAKVAAAGRARVAAEFSLDMNVARLNHALSGNRIR